MPFPLTYTARDLWSWRWRRNRRRLVALICAATIVVGVFLLTGKGGLRELIGRVPVDEIPGLDHDDPAADVEADQLAATVITGTIDPSSPLVAGLPVAVQISLPNGTACAFEVWSYRTDLPSCADADVFGRRLAVDHGVIVSVDAPAALDAYASVCRVMQGSERQSYELPNVPALATALSASGVCPGDPSKLVPSE